MVNYVLGFMFDETLDKVILIKKNRPDWQKGLLNGVGGKIEPDEFPCDAMSREFLEETGVDIDPAFWKHVFSLSGVDYNLWIFTIKSKKFWKCMTKTDEHVYLKPVEAIVDKECISNLKWIIPACRYFLINPNETIKL